MSATTPLTITFRGLMILHFGSEKGKEFLEVGILRAPGHIPRITTFRKGTGGVDGTPHLLPEAKQRGWRLDVPGGQGVTRRQKGAQFDRMTHDFEQDFRFIMDLEGGEFYSQDLTKRLDTRGLMPVIRVPAGDLFTRLESGRLRRKKGNGPFDPFGQIAAVTACDLTFKGEEVRLLEGRDVIFTFRKDPGVEIYEIRNTPPADDETPPVPVPSGAGHTHHGPGGQHDDHFQFYYDIFRDLNGIEKFEFRQEGNPQAGPHPIPDPQLCGQTMLSRRTSDL